MNHPNSREDIELRDGGRLNGLVGILRDAQELARAASADLGLVRLLLRDRTYVFGWVEAVDQELVTLTVCIDGSGSPDAYPLHVVMSAVVAVRYADLYEVGR